MNLSLSSHTSQNLTLWVIEALGKGMLIKNTDNYSIFMKWCCDIHIESIFERLLFLNTKLRNCETVILCQSHHWNWWLSAPCSSSMLPTQRTFGAKAHRHTRKISWKLLLDTNTFTAKRTMRGNFLLILGIFREYYSLTKCWQKGNNAHSIAL